MTKHLKDLFEELEIHEEESNCNLLAVGGYDGGDDIEVVQFTVKGPYIVRVRPYQRFYERETLYFNFNNEKALIEWLEEVYR